MSIEPRYYTRDDGFPQGRPLKEIQAEVNRTRNAVIVFNDEGFVVAKLYPEDATLDAHYE